MSSKRTVTLKVPTQKGLLTFETSARTFGELKEELGKDVSFSGVKVVERSKKVTLEVPEAILPATDFMLFLVPEKVKAGGAEHLDDIDDASYNELRSHGSYLNKNKGGNVDLSGDKESLRRAISSYYQRDIDEVNENIVLIEEARANINMIFDKLVEQVQECDDNEEVDTTEYVVKLTMEDLNKEIDEIKSHLKL